MNNSNKDEKKPYYLYSLEEQEEEYINSKEGKSLIKECKNAIKKILEKVKNN